MEDKLGINEIREFNQMNLDSFTFNKQNMFESSADLVIKKLIEEKENNEKERDEWIRIKKYKPQRYEELENIADIADIDLEMQINEYDIENFFREEEIWALLEMKIIYLYKFFEINIKKLLKGSYPETSIKEFFRWESLTQFLKNKNINPKEINGYKEVFQLKELNNSFKHSDDLDKQIINLIPELKKKDSISYIELNEAYERLSNFPIKFLKDLSSKIYDELYEFNESKIEKIANEIAIRMEEKNALILIDKIKKVYKT